MSKLGDELFKDTEITKLIEIMGELDAGTKAEVLNAISAKMTQAGKVQAIAKIKAIIQTTDPLVKDWISKAIPNSYILGIKQADKNLKRKIADITVEDLKTLKDLSIHAEAVNSLMGDAYLDFANSMNGLVRGAEKQINQALKLQVRAKIGSNLVTGMDIRQAKKDVIKALGDKGFSVLVDRGGNSWTLPRYSEMLARTHTIRSYNDATINRSTQFGVDLVQISTHAGSCSVCAGYEGNIYSLSGNNTKYPYYDIDLPIHPNCTHNLLMRPDLQDEADYK